MYYFGHECGIIFHKCGILFHICGMHSNSIPSAIFIKCLLWNPVMFWEFKVDHYRSMIHDIWCALFGTGTKCITLMFCYRRDKDTQYGGLSDLEKKKWQHLSIGNLISAINNILDQILSKKNILHFLLDFQKGKCLLGLLFSLCSICKTKLGKLWTSR